MSDRCVNIDDKDFKVLQKEVNINPYILATKVKLWQDKQENEADKNRLPTAQELNIAPVFVVVEKKAAPVETPQPTQEEQLKNEIQKLQSQRKDIEKQIESLDKEISKTRNPLKKITKRKKLRKLEYELDSVVYKESLLSKERNQNKAEEDVVKQNPVTEEEVLPQVNEESERLIINNSTEFNNFPAELRYELIVHHIRKYGSGLVVGDLSNMNEVLANVSTGVIEAIESSLKKASYANIINNFNKTKNAPKSDAKIEKPVVVSEKEVDEVVESKSALLNSNMRINQIPINEITQKNKETESKLENEGVTDLFIGATLPTDSPENAVPVSIDVINGIAVVRYANEKTGLIDTIISGFSENNFVGYYRIYENGKPTNKWSSKFENQETKNEDIDKKKKENFKTMISSVQERLPSDHKYTEKTSISTDGLRLWVNQIDLGIYKLEYDKSGNLITNRVAINGDALVNDLGVPVKKGKFLNIRVKNQEEFDKVKKALLPYLEKFGLTEDNIYWKKPTAGPEAINGNIVSIDLPVLSPIIKLEDKTGVTITGGTKQNLKKPRTKVKVGDVLSVNVRYGEENIAEGYEYSVDVLNKDGEVIGALPYESKEAKEVLNSNNPNQAKVTIVYVSPISSNGVIGFSATVSVDEAADEVEEKKFKQLNITSFEKLIPGLTDIFTREETQEFKKEYNNINSAEERADYLANLEDRVKQKKLENENAENGLTKEQAQELVDKVNANTEELRKNRKFPNSKVGFNRKAASKPSDVTTIPRNIIEDFIATDNTFSSRRKLKEQMLNDLFNFYSLSKQYNPTNTFARTSRDELYDAVRTEMNNQYKDRRLSRNAVIKTNNFLRSKNFPFKVEYDFFNSPRLVPVAKKTPVSKPKQTDVVDVTFQKARDFALTSASTNPDLIGLALAIDALGPSGEYGLWNDRTRDVGVRRESGQEGYIFDRDSKLPKNKTKIYNRVDELADDIYEEIPELYNDITTGKNALEEAIKLGSIANMKAQLIKDAEVAIIISEGGITPEEQARQEALSEALILEETQFEEASKGVYTDESLNEFYNTLDSYQNSIEYKIEVGAYTGTRESLTDVQKDLYDRAAAEGLYEQEVEQEVVEEDFDSILAREAQNNLYNIAAKNLQEYGIESFSNPRSLVSEVIKALRNSDVIDFNKPLDIINTVLEKQYSSTLSKGQVAEVKRQLIDFINNPSMSFGVYQVLQPIGNIQPGVYTIEISNFNTLAFTNVQALEKPKTTISVDEFISNGAPESVDNFKIIQADQTVINSNLIDTVMNKEDLTSLNESLSDIFSNFTSNISEFDNLEKTDLNNQIIEEFNKCK